MDKRSCWNTKIIGPLNEKYDFRGNHIATPQTQVKKILPLQIHDAKSMTLSGAIGLSITIVI